MAFAETLADLRRSRGLTQVALAERAGVNVSQLRKYEAGGSEPSLSALRRLAVALSCTPRPPAVVVIVFGLVVVAVAPATQMP